MKSTFKKWVSTLLAVVMLVSLTGCGGDIKTNSVVLDYGDKYDMIISSTDQINCDYLFVYHVSSSYAEIEAYIDLLEKASASSTATFQLCPDSLNIPDKEQKIILLGDTNYNESTKSKNLLETIRKNNYFDYLFRAYTNTISINWVSKFGREDAFGYLLGTLIPNGLDKAFAKGYSYLSLSSRSDSPIVTIDDVNIVQYTVVLPEAPSRLERSVAEKLIKVIKEATGTELPLVTDDVEESTYEILIGDTNRGETYVTSFFADNRFAIAQYSTKLIVRGGKLDATVAATELLATNIENSYITAEPLHIRTGQCDTGVAIGSSKNVFDGYELVFSDEFESYKLNDKLWNSKQTYLSTYGSAPMTMLYKPSNVHFDGSNLILRTFLGSDGYETAKLSTENKESFKYGYFETRVRLRTAPGVWAKLMLTNKDYNNGDACQIDVFNTLSKKDNVFASVGVVDNKTYYKDYLNLNKSSYEGYRDITLKEGDYLTDDQYHTFGVEWTETHIKYYLDGMEYGVVDITGDTFKNLNQEMYLNFLIGVEFTEEKVNDEDAQWPMDFEIDWIKVYQKSGQTMSLGEYATSSRPS